MIFKITPNFPDILLTQERHMCTDYHYLNEQTIKNAYPLPLISETIDKVGKAKVFTKLDLHWGYNNVWIKEGDEWKAAFATCHGSFEPLVMFFGMTNNPSTFQNMMNDIMKDLIDCRLVIVFIDDILIYMETEEGHDNIV
jgi:Reverse transcriptase (RNA-dependent DNA polymerase)